VLSGRATLILAGCEAPNPDGTKGEPGSYEWFLSASQEQRLAYYEGICQSTDGLARGTPENLNCARTRLQRTADRYYQVTLDMAAISRPPPQTTINVNVDPGPVTCRQTGTLIRCD
jgi:hypothetical protein